MLDPYWLEGTRPLWVLIALLYGLGGTYLRAFSRRNYPWWTWGTFLGIGAAIFLGINGDYWISDTNALLMIEYFMIVMLAIGGAVLFVLSVKYTELMDQPVKTVQEEI